MCGDNEINDSYWHVNGFVYAMWPSDQIYSATYNLLWLSTNFNYINTVWIKVTSVSVLLMASELLIVCLQQRMGQWAIDSLPRA